MDYYTEYKNKLNDVRENALECGLCEELVKSIQIPTDTSKPSYAYIKHPLVNEIMTDLSQPVMDMRKANKKSGMSDEKLKKMFPLFCFDEDVKNNADLYNHKLKLKKEIETKYIKKKDWVNVLWNIETPFQLEWFFVNSDLITDDKEFYELLRELYELNDFPLCCLGGGRGVANLIDLIESRDNPYLMMDEKEMKMFNKLDDELTIYRGVSVEDKEYGLQTDADEIGISWSIDKNEAQKFALRQVFSKVPILLETTINKKDVYGYFISRKEKELLINPYELKDTIKVEELDKELGIGLWKDLENV